jgi:hypothetical protein
MAAIGLHFHVDLLGKSCFLSYEQIDMQNTPVSDSAYYSVVIDGWLSCPAAA